MSDPIIRLDRVSKMYRLFHSPRYRMMEALGLPVSSSRYEEFWPLRDISLEIKAGERVGLVGRNGAGKSTLLKLIADLVQPTEGTVIVCGAVQALMELGTGFHPEFTGRENVLSSLAYQGVTGGKALRLLEDILEFSELEDFIDKPIKTYSAGMYSRLAFAAATAIRPEILIIDEILGAGDAYFAGKSAKRMRTLTAEGTTVLFVSHDMSAVQMICDRAVWIERGRVVGDGDPIEIGRLYAASIRKQEELRLRAINLKLSRGDVSELLTDSEAERVFIVRFVSERGGAPSTPVRFYDITLQHRDEAIDKAIVGGAADDDRNQRVHLLTAKGYMDWGTPQSEVDGRAFREFADCKGQYRHAPVSVRIPLALGALADFSVRVAHSGSPVGEDVLCQVFDGVEYITLGKLKKVEGHGSDHLRASISQTFSFAALADETHIGLSQHEPVRSDFVYGEGTAWIDSVDFLDSSSVSRRVFSFGEMLTVEVRWVAKKNISCMAFVVCLYGMDGRCVTQVVSPFVAATDSGRSGLIRAEFSPLMVGKGDYIVSVGIFDGLTEAQATGEKPLDVHDRQYRIRILAPTDIKMDRGQVVHPVRWSSRSTEE